MDLLKKERSGRLNMNDWNTKQTFDTVVEEIKNYEKGLKRPAKPEYEIFEIEDLTPIKVHIEGITFPQLLTEVEKIEKIIAATTYDKRLLKSISALDEEEKEVAVAKREREKAKKEAEAGLGILMEEMRRAKAKRRLKVKEEKPKVVEKEGKKEGERREEKKVREKVRKKIEGISKEPLIKKATEFVKTKMPKKKAEKLSQEDQLKKIEEINAKRDYVLISYAREYIKELYDKFNTGEISPERFRTIVRKQIARSEGISEELIETKISEEANPFEELSKAKGREY